MSRRKHRNRNKRKGNVVVPSTGTATTYKKPACHTGPVQVFRTGDATVWAGSRDEILYARKNWSLFICCAGEALAPTMPLVSSPGAADLVKPIAERVPWITINWPDGGAPWRVPKASWLELAMSLKMKIEGNVGIYCMAGHGRTGTATSILASLCGAVPEDRDPVAWLRKQYCHNAVESDDQVEYIEHVTGRKVTAVGSWMSDWGDYFLQKFFKDEEPAAANTAGGKAGTPITNAAGDVVGWKYD